MQPRARRLTTAVALATVVVLALLGGAAYAAWNASGTGTGDAKAQALSAPTASATAQSSSSIQVTWTVGTQPPGTTYSVVRNGTTTLSCTSSPCTDTGLATSTSYSYVVTAKVGSAWVASSNTTSATTSAPATATKLAVSIASTVTAGAPVTITLTAQDNANNTVTSYTGGTPITWTGSATAASPNGTAPTLTTGNVTFTNGVATLTSRKLTSAGTNLTLSAGQGSISGSTTVTVTAASVTRLAYTAMTFSTNPGFTTCYTGCTAPNQSNNGSVTAKVALVDDFGNLGTRGSTTTVNFTPAVGTSNPSVVVTPSGSTDIASGASTSTWSVKLTEGTSNYTTTLTAAASSLTSIGVTISKN